MNFIVLYRELTNKMKGLKKTTQNQTLFIAGLVIFTILNLFSACTMELHFDEAYYWIWSQSTSLGYFDHPPMIAWLIKAGQLIFDGELGIRFFTIVLSSLSMIVLWRIMRRYSPNALLFWSLIYSVCLIHPYSFITTPDAPLFFFSILFFYFFYSYLENNTFRNTILLAFIIALVIYSKYHAFLFLGLVVLCNLKLLKRFSFWIILLLTIIYLLPHILWQFEYDFPSFRYHLFESHKTIYNPLLTLKYIFSELAITGPWLGWLFLYILFTIKTDNQWEKTLKFTGIGIFIFFLITTLGGDFEAHWTLVAFIPLIILSYKYVLQNPKWQRWVIIGGSVNFILLIALRIFIISPEADHIKAFKPFSHNKENVEKIKKLVGDVPVLFQDDWIDASLYSYYTHDTKTGNLNSAFYRRNQFDIIDADEALAGQTVTILSTDSLQFEKPIKIITDRAILYKKTIENFHSYYNLKIKLKDYKTTSNSQTINLTISNPYNEKINLGNEAGVNTSFQLWMKKGKKWEFLAENGIGNIEILPESSLDVQANFDNTTSLLKGKEVYLMLKIGDLKPIPSKCLLDF